MGEPTEEGAAMHHVYLLLLFCFLHPRRFAWRRGWLGDTPRVPVRARMGARLMTPGTASPAPPASSNLPARPQSQRCVRHCLQRSATTGAVCPNACARGYVSTPDGERVVTLLPEDTHGAEHSVPRILKAASVQRAPAPRGRRGSAAAPCGRERRPRPRTAPSGRALGSRGRAAGSP